MANNNGSIILLQYRPPTPVGLLKLLAKLANPCSPENYCPYNYAWAYHVCTDACTYFPLL